MSAMKFSLKAWFMSFGVAVAVTGGFGPALRAQESPKGDKMFVTPFEGWPEGIYLSSAESKVEAVIVPAIGGRVQKFSLNGENILFDNPLARGQTLAKSKDFWTGGYQCDIGPEIRGVPDHNLLDKAAWTWKATGAYAVDVESETDPALGLRMKKKFVFDTDIGDLGIDQVAENATNRDVSFCFWDRTVCRNGGIVFFPLNTRSRFPARWSLRRTVDGKFQYDGKNPSIEQVKVVDGVLFAQTQGLATKIGADSDAGWVAYARADTLFVKYFAYDPKGEYSDGGNSVELYFDQAVAEIEPLSPEYHLRPGEKKSFPEKWSLIPLEKEVVTIDDARKLVRQIPPSPFRR
jgi:hypothetical protein